MTTGYFAKSDADGARLMTSTCTSDRLDPTIVTVAIVASTRTGIPAESGKLRVTRSTASASQVAATAVNDTTCRHVHRIAAAGCDFTPRIIISPSPCQFEQSPHGWRA